MLKMTFNKLDGNAWEGSYKGDLPCPSCGEINHFYCDPGENRIQTCAFCNKDVVKFEWKSNPGKP